MDAVSIACVSERATAKSLRELAWSSSSLAAFSSALVLSLPPLLSLPAEDGLKLYNVSKLKEDEQHYLQSDSIHCEHNI